MIYKLWNWWEAEMPEHIYVYFILLYLHGYFILKTMGNENLKYSMSLLKKVYSLLVFAVIPRDLYLLD